MGQATSIRTPNTQLFRDVFNASPIGIAVETLEGQPLFVNPAFCRFLGFTEEELRGKHCVDFSPREDAEKDWALFQQLRAGSIDHYQLEKRYVRRDGSLVWGHLSLSLLKSHPTPLVVGMVQDITEKKAAEEAVRASEERLRLAQQVARIGAFERDIPTGVLTWTPELEAMYGLPVGSFERTLSAARNLIHPDDRARVIELQDEAVRTGQPTSGEWRVVWPDGSLHWLAARWQLLMDDGGAPSRVVGVSMDVTERKLTEQALVRANERLQLAIESGSVGGWDFDLKTDRNVWFGKAHAQLGTTREETSGTRQEFWDRVHEDDREHLRHAIRAAKEKQEEFLEDFRVVWRDGTTHWLRSRGRYQYAANGEPERMLGISLDITQSKQAEQALRENQQRFLLAAQAGKMYSFEWDVRTGAVVRSPEYVSVLGATEQLRSTHRQFVEKIHPDDRPRFLSTISALTPENPTAVVTFRVVSPDAGLMWLRSSGRGIFDNQGKMLRVIGMVADVTDLKRAEEALAGMTRKLIESQEQDRARIGRDLHDDINQKLALLAVEVEQLRQNLPEPSAQISSGLSGIRDRVTAIATDVQSISHQLHSPQLEILGIVAAMRGFCREFAARQRVDIDFTHRDVPTFVPHEVSLCLFRVLQEALHNAVKHSNVRHYEVRLGCAATALELTVADQGSGFDTTLAMSSGGLGLTSMQERVRLVNGVISIESKLQAGTVIRVRIPIPSEIASQRAAG